MAYNVLMCRYETTHSLTHLRMERTFNADRQFRHHDVIVVYVYAECANENHTISSIMAI